MIRPNLTGPQIVPISHQIHGMSFPWQRQQQQRHQHTPFRIDDRVHYQQNYYFLLVFRFNRNFSWVSDFIFLTVRYLCDESDFSKAKKAIHFVPVG